jgi:hypothetical protein
MVRFITSLLVMFLNSYRRRLRFEALIRGIVTEERGCAELVRNASGGDAVDAQLETSAARG